MLYNYLIRPILFRSDAEQAHDFIHAFGRDLCDNKTALTLINSFISVRSSRLHQNILGISFENPVGLAAGFDKNAQLSLLMQSLGFGFTEVGSITANPSNGNPKPRMFRLPGDRAIINRMGLNNEGAEVITDRIRRMERPGFPLGINIAKTHDPSILGDQAISDYVQSFKLAEPLADYVTINISCPNTEEGKTFEDPEALHELLTAISQHRSKSGTPVFVKLSADLTQKDLHVLLEVCERMHVDGYIATNTSAKRDYLTNASSGVLEQIGRGGLSGHPIFQKSLRIVRDIYTYTEGNKPIIGVGGIDTPQKAIEMIACGASLIQLYTGLVYQGPTLVQAINRGLVRHLDANGMNNISELRGSAIN